MATTIAIISDTHLPRGTRAPAARLRRAHRAPRTSSCTRGTSPPRRSSTELEALGPPVHAVHGNVDGPELRDRLPESLEVEVGGVRIALVHDAGPAAGRLARMRRRFPGVDAVVFGHSHIPLHETAVEAGFAFQLFNPGSPTDRRRQPHHTMGMARVDGDQLGFSHVRL